MKNPGRKTGRGKNHGREGEELVCAALEILKQKSDPVVEYHYSKPGGEIDGLKIDFLIFLKNHLCMPLQVKTGSHVGHAIREHYRHCPYVLAIHIRMGHTAEKISRQIEILIIRHLKHPEKDRVHRGEIENPDS